MSALRHSPARYPILRFEPQSFEIPKGGTSGEKILNLPTSKPPRMVFLTSFNTEGVHGKSTISAYRAKASAIEAAYVQIEDQRYPNQPYDCTSREGQIKLFADYKRNTSQLMGGRNNFIDFDRFSQDFTMMSISLDRYHGTENSLPRNGSASVHIKLKSSATDPITVLVILVYNSSVTFNEALIPHTDY